MNEPKQLLFARNLICICIDRYENEDYSGRLWHQYQDEPIDFASVAEMIGIMDDLFDEWDFPQKGLAQRSFAGSGDVWNMHTDSAAHVNRRADNYNPGVEGTGREASRGLIIDQISRRCGIRNIQNRKGEMGTFVVQVEFRQRATWQGRIIYQEKNESREFVSELDMVRFIDKSLEDIKEMA